MTTDYSGLNAFLAVAATSSFREAADRLGVTRPAISQSIRKLEDELGIALVQRTTRSVRLTEAGVELRDQVRPAMVDIHAAVARLKDQDREPRGQLRLAVSSIAESFLAGEMLASFTAAYPGVQLDVMVTDEEFDIVAAGYDAGVRLGEVLEQDMVAVPVSGPQRQLVVAAPGYVDRYGIPAHPRELVKHRCIGWRPRPDTAPYRWDFVDGGQTFDVAINPEVTTNDMRVMLNTALAGGGFTLGMEETFRPHLDRGALVSVLDAFCPPFPGFFLYFPDRRNHAPKLRAFIDHIRQQQSGGAGSHGGLR